MGAADDRKLHLKKPEKEDVLRSTSDLPGLGGVLEGILRRFRLLSFLLCLTPLVFLGLGVMGLCLSPAVFLFIETHEWVHEMHPLLQSLALGMSISFGYFIYGLSLIFIVPAVNFMLFLKVKAWRGSWYSLRTIPWYVHNGLTYLVRYTFLDLVTPTPLTNLFYKLMGMKIGKGVIINTTNISDPCLITLEDYVTIGGSATLFAHYGQKGYLVIAPVHIKRGATIGLHASVMGETVVGENVNVRPHQVVMPKTIIPDNTTF